jgi:glycosyltransferase A (GT-A) superfamily protein (DUF2064 family)
MIKSFAILALLGAPTTETAPRCVTKRQVADAAMVIAPIAVEAVREKCQSHLPAEAYLARQGTALVTRLTSESAGREESAAEALLATMGKDAPPMKDKRLLVPAIGDMATAMMVKELRTEQCGEVSGLVEALSPLPAEHIGLLVTSLVNLMESTSDAKAGKKSKGTDSFTICKNG